jgi:hypothetical protein
LKTWHFKTPEERHADPLLIQRVGDFAILVVGHLHTLLLVASILAGDWRQVVREGAAVGISVCLWFGVPTLDAAIDRWRDRMIARLESRRDEE